jgi:hypothetical protein
MNSTHKNEPVRDSEAAENASSTSRVPHLDTIMDKTDDVDSSEPSPTAEKARDVPAEEPTEKNDEVLPPGPKPPPEALERGALKTAIIMFALCVSLVIALCQCSDILIYIDGRVSRCTRYCKLEPSTLTALILIQV